MSDEICSAGVATVGAIKVRAYIQTRADHQEKCRG